VQRSTEEVVPGSSAGVVSSDSDGLPCDEEPSQMEELADFMEQVWFFFFKVLRYLFLTLTKNSHSLDSNIGEMIV
jgi:E1A-binding protein p400